MWILNVAAGLICALVTVPTPSCQDPTPAGSLTAQADVPVTVWQQNSDDYHTYRIPSIIGVPSGDLLAFCEGRRSGRGDAGNIDLVMKRSTDHGQTWSEQTVLWDDGVETCGNPCPVVDETTGVIWMLMTHNLGADDEGRIIHGTARSTRTVWVMSSADNGHTWTQPREITATTKQPDWGWYATGPGNGIQIRHGAHSGRLVIPCDHSYDDPAGNVRGGPYGFGSHAIFSDDHGQTWQLGGHIRPHANECQVVELSDPPGALLMNCRSYFGRSRRSQAVSTDGGLTWTAPQDAVDLVEPVCQASIIRQTWPSASMDGILLFSNPADAKNRVRMSIKVSDNEGTTWQPLITLHAGPSAYSSLVRLSDDSAGCLYEAGAKSAYEKIVFHRFQITR